MNEVQIQIVKPQMLHGALKSPLGTLIAGVRDPQLCGDKQFLSGNSAAPDRFADRFLVSIGGSRVDQPIACMNGLHNGLFARFGIRHTEYTVADLRHGDSVI